MNIGPKIIVPNNSFKENLYKNYVANSTPNIFEKYPKKDISSSSNENIINYKPKNNMNVIRPYFFISNLNKNHKKNYSKNYNLPTTISLKYSNKNNIFNNNNDPNIIKRCIKKNYSEKNNKISFSNYIDNDKEKHKCNTITLNDIHGERKKINPLFVSESFNLNNNKNNNKNNNINNNDKEKEKSNEEDNSELSEIAEKIVKSFNTIKTRNNKNNIYLSKYDEP